MSSDSLRFVLFIKRFYGYESFNESLRMFPRSRYDCYCEVAIWNVRGLLGKNSPGQNCSLDLLISFSPHRFN